jgi:hypothetical protein
MNGLLLERTAVLGERKNGYRRRHGASDEPRLRKVRLSPPAGEVLLPALRGARLEPGELGELPALPEKTG